MGDALKKRIQQERFENSLQVSLLNVIVAASHIKEHFEALCARHGITSSQYNVLRILRGVHPNGHCRSEISKRMVDRAPDVTRIIDRLEKQGLVKRSRSGNDRRQSITKITRKGLQLLHSIHPDQDLQKYFGIRISLQDQEQLSRICEGIYADDL